MNAITLEKNALRSAMRKRLAEITDNRRRAASESIRRFLCSLPEFRRADTVMTYLSMSGEVDTLDFAKEVLMSGKKLIVPKVSSNPRGLQACEIRSLSEGLVPSSYGIMEPDEAHLKIALPGEIAFHVIPGLAFDRVGARLGRGGGYYDRFLKTAAPGSFKVGVCYRCQIVDGLPREFWDIPVDCAVTEKEILRFSS